MIVRKSIALMALLLVALPATAQDVPSAGRVASSSAGRVGQRQTREQAAPFASPMARLNSRIANRVQSRIRNRVDRNYGPQVDTVAAIESAQNETLRAVKSSPR
jgi:hypothetical protein